MGGQDRQVTEVAVAARVVEAVADDELVGDVEPDVTGTSIRSAPGLRNIVMISRLAGLRLVRFEIR